MSLPYFVSVSLVFPVGAVSHPSSFLAQNELSWLKMKWPPQAFRQLFTKSIWTFPLKISSPGCWEGRASLSLSWLITGISWEDACTLLVEKWLLSSWGPRGLALLLLVSVHLHSGYWALLGARTACPMDRMFGKYGRSRPSSGMERGPNFQGLQNRSVPAWTKQVLVPGIHMPLTRGDPRRGSRWGLRSRPRD